MKSSDKLKYRKHVENTSSKPIETEDTKKEDARPKVHSDTSNRLWARAVLVICFMIILYYYSNKEKEYRFAIKNENIPMRFQKFDCSESFQNDINQYPDCKPKICGRFVTDDVVNILEAEIMLDMAKKGMSFGGSSGGASILDLHSGALSHGEKFINIYNIPEIQNIFENQHKKVYEFIKKSIMEEIAEKFEINTNKLYLTHPTFFSRINNVTAKTVHDEYWHQHVDKETYESFHYTSLVYLTDFGIDFNGGRFIFVNGIEGKNQSKSSVEPKKGRVIVFTSGSENLHFVEKVTNGERFAITISFTCNPKFAIDDPKININ